MRRLTRSLAVVSLVVSLAATTATARPNQDDGNPGASGPITRIVRLIKQLVRVVLEDPSYPKP
jgi:hypothetical protein